MTCPSAAKKSCGSHLFGVCPGEADKTALVQELSKAITFCVRSYPGKISYSNSAKRELSNDVPLLEVFPRKVALYTSSHLTPIEEWQSAVSTPSKGRRVSSEVRLGNCTQVWWVGQIWTACNSPLRKNSAFTAVLTCPNLSEPVWTSPQYSDHVRPSRNVIFCTFECFYSSVLRRILVKLHILTRLMKSFPMAYGLWRCIEVKLSIPPGAHA